MDSVGKTSIEKVSVSKLSELITSITSEPEYKNKFTNKILRFLNRDKSLEFVEFGEKAVVVNKRKLSECKDKINELNKIIFPDPPHSDAKAAHEKLVIVFGGEELAMRFEAVMQIIIEQTYKATLKQLTSKTG